MRKININLPKYRLQLNLKLIKRRKSSLAEPFIPTTKLVNRKYRKGTFLGKFFRHIFEHKNIKKTLATNFAIISVATSLVSQNIEVQAQDINSVSSVVEAKVVFSTEKGTQYPTQNVSITQGYSFFHPGVDLDGITGDTIKPIKPGRVVLIETSRFGYGNSILINHGNGLISRYAHLSKIEVSMDQEVNIDTEIGKMGATGHASGDHLHLEVIDHGRAINPLSILP